jgi:hypothetical protein
MTEIFFAPKTAWPDTSLKPLAVVASVFDAISILTGVLINICGGRYYYSDGSYYNYTDYDIASLPYFILVLPLLVAKLLTLAIIAAKHGFSVKTY